MRRGIARLRGFGFVLWHARHMMYHIGLGLLWAWFLREWWGEFNLRWVITAIVGSVLPDIDHFFYFFGYGRGDAYTKILANFFRKHEWRNLAVFMETGHKYNTNLSFHNIFITGIFFVVSWVASLFDWEFGVVLFGAIVSHYLFDMFDDVVQLGSLNTNWKRWGRGRV